MLVVVILAPIAVASPADTILDHLQDGYRALGEGRLDDAAAAYRRALEMAGGGEQTFHAAFGLGSALLAAGRPAEAVKAFSVADRADPGRPELLRLLADAQLSLGDRPAAVSTLGRLIERAPEDPDAYRALGRLLAASAQHEEASKVFSRGVLRFPADVGMRVGLAVELYHQGLFERADAVFSAALELDPSDPRAHFGRAMARLALDDRASAEAELGRLRELDAHLARQLAENLGLTP